MNSSMSKINEYSFDAVTCIKVPKSFSFLRLSEEAVHRLSVPQKFSHLIIVRFSFCLLLSL